MQEVTGLLTGDRGTVSMSWGCSQGSHCHQIRSQQTSEIRIRMTIPTVQARQLKESSRGIPGWLGQLLAQLLRWGTSKSCIKSHNRTAPGDGGDGAELNMAPLGTSSAGPDVQTQLTEVLLLPHMVSSHGKEKAKP